MSLKIKTMILKLAAYYGHDVTKEQVEVYAEQLARNLSEDEVSEAVRLYLDNPTNEFFPRPMAKLIALIKSPVSNTSVAQKVVSLIRQAMNEKGPSWVTGYFNHKDPETGEAVFYFEGKSKSFWTWQEAALDYLGEVGVEVVRHYGGWQRLSEMFDESPDTVIGAQLLRSTEAILELNKQGKLNEVPSLPPPLSAQNIINLLQIKELPKIGY